MGVRLRRRFGVDHGRLTAYEDEHLVAPEAGDVGAQPDPRRRDRAATRRSDARHRRDDPAGAGRDRPRGRRDDGMRTGRAGHRQDRGRPAPGGLAALRVPPPAAAVRRPRRRSQPRVPRPRRRGAARPSARSRSGHTTVEELVGGAAGSAAATRPPSRPQGRRAARRGPAPRGLVARRPRRPRRSSCPAASRRWRVPAYDGHRDPRGAAHPRRSATARPRRCCRSGSRTPSCSQMERAATPRTTGCRTPWRARGGPRLRRTPVAGARPAAACCSACSRRPGRWPVHADGLLDAGRAAPAALGDAAAVARARPAGRRADPVLLDELADLLERTPSLGHVVLDEAQDLSPMQLRAVGRRCSTGSATVLGDIAQGTTPWATDSWDVAAGAPREAGRPHRGARPRVPGAGVGHRLRGAAAAARSHPGWARRSRCGRTRAG